MRKDQDAPVIKALAAELKLQRGKRNFSQEELAHRAGVHRTFIARIEVTDTQPSIAVLFRISDALGVRASDMLRNIEQRMADERP